MFPAGLFPAETRKKQRLQQQTTHFLLLLPNNHRRNTPTINLRTSKIPVAALHTGCLRVSALRDGAALRKSTLFKKKKIISTARF